MRITTCMLVFGVLSAAILAASWFVAHSDHPTFGRQGKQPLNPITIIVGAALAAFAYDVGQQQGCGDAGWNILDSLFRTLQMITIGAELPRFCHSQLLGVATTLYHLYTPVIFIAAPASTVVAAAMLLARYLSMPLAVLQSWRRDVFVFSSLDASSMALGKSIARAYETGDGKDPGATERACIVYASVGDEGERSLAFEAREFGGLCVENPVDQVLRRCRPSHQRTAIICGRSDADNLATAASMKEEAARLAGKGQCVQVIVFSQLKGSEALLFPEVTGRAGKGTGLYRIRGVDVIHEAVVDIVERCPTFLVARGSSLLSDDAAKWVVDKGLDDGAYLEALYGDDRRHVAVVGAGHTGMEFLSAALWCSRVDGMETRIDVIDRAADAGGTAGSRAEAHFRQRAPEIASPVGDGNRRRPDHAADDGHGDGQGYELDFLRMDVGTAAYDAYLTEHAGTLTYLFVALGDDLTNARVAMHSRHVLERELARRSDGRDAFLAAPRPTIVAVIEDDDLREIVGKAANDGHRYAIACLGGREERYSYDRIIWNDRIKKDREEYLSKGKTVTEYKHRSGQAAEVHKKYKLFAFCRRLYQGSLSPAMWTDGDLDLSGALRAVDWRAPLGEIADKTPEIVKAYNDYIDATAALRGLGEKHGGADHEWLLRMEHDRWNAYIRTEGFVSAPMGLTRTIFDTGQEDVQRHRHNLAGLHPCLVPFDELEGIDRPVKELYAKAMGAPGASGRAFSIPSELDESQGGDLPRTFQAQDANYLKIEPHP